MSEDSNWSLVRRTGGAVERTVKARELWCQIGHAAWACADPGVQFHDTINSWHTCPASGPIRASNPCSEYMFLDDTACGLASLNLGRFVDDGKFQCDKFEHVIRIFTIALEISVGMGQYPSREIASRSNEFRTLGLGFSNLAGLLMALGHPYDSAAGRSICGAISAILSGVAYSVSAEMAAQLGPFSAYKRNSEHMLRVIRNHRRAAYSEGDSFEGLPSSPVLLDDANCPDIDLIYHARASWDVALQRGLTNGFRNAQVTAIAPTGTIGLLMDCDTGGIEPDFAIVKFKKLAGGGYFKMINQSVPGALRRLGYRENEISEIIAYAVGHGSLAHAPDINHSSLLRHGFRAEEIAKIEAALPSAFDIRFVLNPWVLGRAFCSEALGVLASDLDKPDFDLLHHLGFVRAQIEAANDYVCGTMTLEGAPLPRDKQGENPASIRMRTRGWGLAGRA